MGLNGTMKNATQYRTSARSVGVGTRRPSTMTEYEHPEHGEMEWIDTYNGWDKKVEGWRCTRCHVIAEPDRADEVFDDHDCDQYKSVREGVSDVL